METNNTQKVENKFPGLIPVTKKSKSNKKWEQRARVAKMIEDNVPVRDIAEINRENALKNLPSSMR